MAEQLDQTTFTGAHPTARQFHEQLLRWGFTRRRDEGPHLVMRAPGGGTLRLLRALTGRADPALMDKATRLLRISEEQFWAGPPATPAPLSAPRRPQASHDHVTSLVLAAHTQADRPLGFEQVVELCRARANRDQVRHASAALYRDGDLVRVRRGVYQWAGGILAAREAATAPLPELRLVNAPQPSTPPPPHVEAPATTEAGRPASADLLDLLFPHGVRMPAEAVADLLEWTRLTDKLLAYADAS